MKVIKNIFPIFLVLVLFASLVIGGTRVPGHEKERYDLDNNGYPDEGISVNGHYTSIYAYDLLGDWYWDLGDGRILGTVDAVDELEQDTLTVCDYIVNYRGKFENDPFLNSGWIHNNINCRGYDDNNQYFYQIVHKTDLRYRNNPEWSVWGEWEYHTLTISRQGNLVRPVTHSNF